MGMYLVGIFVVLPCVALIIMSYTPKGKDWMRRNGLLLASCKKGTSLPLTNVFFSRPFPPSLRKEARRLRFCVSPNP